MFGVRHDRWCVSMISAKLGETGSFGANHMSVANNEDTDKTSASCL